MDNFYLDNDSLSDIQKTILELIIEGFSEEKISETIYRSIYTVKYHKKIIIKKLHVSNMNQAIAKAVRDEVL